MVSLINNKFQISVISFILIFILSNINSASGARADYKTQKEILKESIVQDDVKIIPKKIVKSKKRVAKNKPKSTARDDFDIIIDQINMITKNNRIKNNTDAIFVISLDNLVLKPINPEFYVNDKKYYPLAEKLLSKVKDSKLPYYREFVLTNYNIILSDKRIAKLIKDLQNKGISVITISTNKSGTFNDIDYIEVWTHELLQKMGINLNKGFYSNNAIVYDSFLKRTKESYPSLYYGLLSCSTNAGYNAEHTVLTYMLNRFQIKPRKLIMLHDNKRLIDITAQQVKKLYPETEFYGFNYQFTTPITDLDSNDPSKLHPKKYIDFWTNFTNELNIVATGGFSTKRKMDPYKVKAK